MSAAQTIAKNTFFLFVMRAIGFVASFVLVLRIGRVLGSEGLGVYSLAVTFLQIFVLVPNFGLDTLAIRDIARDRKRAGPYVANILVAKLALSLPAFLLLVGSVLALRYPPEIQQAILLLAFALFFDPLAEAAAAVYQGFERMELMTLVSGTSKLVVTGLNLYLLETGSPVIHLLGVIVAGSIAVVPAHAFLLRRLLPDLKLRASVDRIKVLLREAYPLFLTNIVGLLYFRTDVVMISKLRDESEVGIYSAAYSILRTLTMIPGVIVTAMYPVLSRAYGPDAEGPDLRRLCDTAFKYQLVLGIPMTVGLAAISHETIDLLYGSEFVVSGGVLGILIWSLVFFFTNTLLGYMLFTANRQKHFLGIKILNLVLNVGLNAALIPRYGAYGAAAATVATLAVSFLLHLRLVSRFLYPVNFARIAFRPLLAAAAMYLALERIGGLPLGFRILIGAAVFALSVLLLGFLTKDDLEIFRNILRRRSASPGGTE